VIVFASNASTIVGLSASPSICLDAHNFMLWKGLTMPSLVGAGLHRHLDSTAAARDMTIKEGVDVPNPEYTRRWITDQRVLSFLFGSMEPVIACQLIGCTSATNVWTAVHQLYGAQSRDNIRHIRHQLQSLWFREKVRPVRDRSSALGRDAKQRNMTQP
jgi:histone deacetylase 1/2